MWPLFCSLCLGFWRERERESRTGYVGDIASLAWKELCWGGLEPDCETSERILSSPVFANPYHSTTSFPLTYVVKGINALRHSPPLPLKESCIPGHRRIICRPFLHKTYILLLHPHRARPWHSLGLGHKSRCDMHCNQEEAVTTIMGFPHSPDCFCLPEQCVSRGMVLQSRAPRKMGRAGGSWPAAPYTDKV